MGEQLGFYVPEGVSDEVIEEQQELLDAYARMEGVEPVTIERDMVYGVGAKGLLLRRLHMSLGIELCGYTF